jgi:hypothetical protein
MEYFRLLIKKIDKILNNKEKGNWAQEDKNKMVNQGRIEYFARIDADI